MSRGRGGKQRPDVQRGDDSCSDLAPQIFSLADRAPASPRIDWWDLMRIPFRNEQRTEQARQ
jgi:hypothetical protein